MIPAIKANALYGGGYPLFTALGRPLIAQLAVEQARASGCDTIAHGCTGKGNDQVRIEATVATLAPELKTIAPVRSWQMGREEEIAYAREHGIPVKGGTEVDALLDRRQPLGPLLGGSLDRGSRATRPRTTSSSSSPAPRRRPTSRRRSTVEFEAGVPVGLDGERLELVELLEAAAEVGARHGVGIVDHIEDRIVGLKVRDIYEAPAAAILLTAHQELEKLVSTIHQNQFKAELDRKWAYLVYAGLWWEPLRTDLDAYMEAANAQVTGTIGLQLYKGSVRVVTRSSPNAVYDADLASFAESGGLFSQSASPGFIELWSLQSRLAHRIRAARRRGRSSDVRPPGQARDRASRSPTCDAATGARSGSAPGWPRSRSGSRPTSRPATSPRAESHRGACRGSAAATQVPLQTYCQLVRCSLTEHACSL